MTMRLRLSLLAVVIGVVASAVPVTARAERAALFVQVPHGFDRTPVAKSAHAAVESGGWKVSEPSVFEQPLGDFVDCVFNGYADQCVPGFLSDGDPDADRAVLVRLTTTGKKGDITTTIVAWIFRQNGETLAVQGYECPRCQPATIASKVGELVAAVVQRARSQARPSFLDLKTTPTGAVVSIDGQRVGLSNQKYKVSPGPHEVAFELEGRQRVTRDVIAGDGETVTIDVALPVAGAATPVSPPADDHNGDGPPEDAPTSTQPPRLAPWLVVGAGATLVVGSGVLILLNEDPVRDGGHFRQFNDNTTRGLVGIVAGAAVAVTGVVWLMRSNHDDGASAKQSLLAPTLEWRGDGAVVGAAGRF